MSLKATVTASGDPARRVTVEIHEDEPAAFASLDYLIKKTLSIEINEEEDGPFK